MTKITVTGGVVSVEDGIKKSEEYAPARKVRVELHFDVPTGEDADAHIAGVSNLAQKHLAMILGGKVSTAAPSGPTKADLEAALKDKLGGELTTDTTKAPASGPKRTGGKKADKAADAPAPAKAPAADPDELELSTGTAEAADDGLGDLLGEEPEPEITDLELNNIVQKVNSVVKDGPTIRKLAAKFVPEGKLPQLSNIPQDKRHAFVTELKALKPAA
jgi:hypothetical protein